MTQVVYEFTRLALLGYTTTAESGGNDALHITPG